MPSSFLRGDADFGQALEASYAASDDDQAWASQLLDAFDGLFDKPRGSALVLTEHAPDMQGARVRLAMGRGAAEAVAVTSQQNIDQVPLHALRTFFYPGSLALTHGDIEHGLSAAARQVSVAYRQRVGVVDALRLMIYPEPGVAGLLYLPLRETSNLARREREWLARLALHLGSAVRVRRRPEVVLATLDPQGAVLDAAHPDATTPTTLSRGVQAIEHCRDGRFRGDPRALDWWTALVDGRASLLARGSGRQRHYLVVENTPLTAATRRLSAFEAEVVSSVARGLPSKLLAYSLGVSPSTISRALQSAGHKLGFASRSELLRMAASVGDYSGPVADATTLTAAEREVLELLRQGHSNQRIAEERGRSTHTIANQVASILRKTGSPSRRAMLGKKPT